MAVPNIAINGFDLDQAVLHLLQWVSALLGSKAMCLDRRVGEAIQVCTVQTVS